MGKKITSKIKGWKGTVTLADPLFLPHVLALRKSLREIDKLDEDSLFEEIVTIQLPALLGCIEDWNIKGRDQPTAETYPITGTGESYKKSVEFITLLHKEVWALFNVVEDDDPES